MMLLQRSCAAALFLLLAGSAQGLRLSPNSTTRREILGAGFAGGLGLLGIRPTLASEGEAPAAGAVDGAAGPSAAATTTTSAFDFSLGVNGKQVPMSKLLGPKATLIINGKLDDPASQSQMPPIVQAVSKYGPKGLHVIIVPSDQGYFEPDEDRVIKIKFFQFHGFGQYPVAAVVDKTDIVGSTAHPLYKYLCRSLKNPNGIGRITLNYEKFLLDAEGKPLRRYPRRYRLMPDMTEDIEAVLEGKDLPEPSRLYTQAWVQANDEALKSEYSFRKNMNYYS